MITGTELKAKFICARPLYGQILRLSGGGLGAPVDVAIPDDEDHFLDELLTTLNSLLADALSSISQFLTFDILEVDGAMGFVEIVYTSSTPLTIDWTQAADFRAYCGLSGSATQQVSSSITIRATRGHADAFYPQWYIVSDTRKFVDRTRQSQADFGNTNTLHIPGVIARIIDIQAIYAEQRAPVWNEWYALEEWFETLLTGRPCKYYPDVDVALPYEAITQGYGFEYFTALVSSVKLPTSAQDSGSIHWRAKFETREWRRAWRDDL